MTSISATNVVDFQLLYFNTYLILDSPIKCYFEALINTRPSLTIFVASISVGRIATTGSHSFS